MSVTLAEYTLHDAVGHLLRHYHYFQILDALTDHLSERDDMEEAVKDVRELFKKAGLAEYDE